VNITVYQVYKAAGEALHGAFVRGYGTILLSDAHTTEDLSA
jgi:hypothetical protein